MVLLKFILKIVNKYLKRPLDSRDSRIHLDKNMFPKKYREYFIFTNDIEKVIYLCLEDILPINRKCFP